MNSDGKFSALYIKEISAYFLAPVAYVITAVFLVVSGYFFAQPLFLINQAQIRSFAEISPLLFAFLAPAVTMKLFAEEKKTGTIEILMTLPVSETQVVAAKYLAAATLLAVILAMTLVYPLTVTFLGKPDAGALAGTYIALVLTSFLFASAGTFASTLTNNQIVSFIVGFIICFILYLLGKVAMFMPLWLSPVTNYLGVDSHIRNLARGVLDFRDLLYYFSAIFAFLCLAKNRIKMTRYE